MSHSRAYSLQTTQDGTSGQQPLATGDTSVTGDFMAAFLAVLATGSVTSQYVTMD